MRRPGSLSSVYVQSSSNSCARCRVGNVPVAGEFVRERAHVARALHVVLTAQRIHANAWPADVARRHREVGDRDHRRRTLAVLGDAKSVIEGGVSTRRIEPRGAANIFCRNAGYGFHGFGAVRRSRTNAAHSSNAATSQRARTNASFTSPSVTITCASAVSIATLVPGFSGR